MAMIYLNSLRINGRTTEFAIPVLTQKHCFVFFFCDSSSPETTISVFLLQIFLVFIRVFILPNASSFDLLISISLVKTLLRFFNSSTIFQTPLTFVFSPGFRVFMRHGINPSRTTWICDRRPSGAWCPSSRPDPSCTGSEPSASLQPLPRAPALRSGHGCA